MAIDEHHPEPTNPLGIAGVEFVEYATTQPQAFGALLERIGFAPIARHRSREVLLYRQGRMNLIVNADAHALPGVAAPASVPVLSAFALRVNDAAFAWKHALDRGAWEMPTRASAMELNIPGIHGIGDSLIYFVDRHADFSIYDVDFVALPNVDPHPPALAGLHWFGIVQTILAGRTADWADFYRHLFGFTVLPGGQFFGILPKGTLLQSPGSRFYLQLIEPPDGADDIQWDERLLRVGLGAPNVPDAVRMLRERGIVFIDRDPIQPTERGALTQIYLGGVTFELVASDETGVRHES
ncbi:MAG TPA: 4-hydroxyphenylpyruvate dioxygenase [Casimicrobiaceae bacterium]|nr:4-hydroxyphenylpyruvate dioxygenase [Casimicrobiaceae bacterium]